MKSTPSPLFFAIAQVAERWQVSARTIRRLITRGDLKVCRIGSQIRVSLEDLVTFEKLNRG